MTIGNMKNQAIIRPTDLKKANGKHILLPVSGLPNGATHMWHRLEFRPAEVPQEVAA